MIDTVPQPSSPRAQVRIEGNYLQAAMQFWTNINTIIWQKLAAILVIQAGTLAFCVQNRGTLTAMAALGIIYALSFFLLLAIYSDQKVRTELIRQINFIAQESMSDFYRENRTKLEDLQIAFPFQLYDFTYDEHHKWIRDIGGVATLFIGLTVLDIWTIFFYGLQSEDFAKSFHLFGLPLIK